MCFGVGCVKLCQSGPVGKNGKFTSQNEHPATPPPSTNSVYMLGKHREVQGNAVVYLGDGNSRETQTPAPGGVYMLGKCRETQTHARGSVYMLGICRETQNLAPVDVYMLGKHRETQNLAPVGELVAPLGVYSLVLVVE